MSTMCRRLFEALLTISGTGSCIPRPGRSLTNDSSQDGSPSNTTNGKPCTTTQPAITPTANQRPTTPPNQNPRTLTRQTSSSSTTSNSSSFATPASSLRSLPSTLRATLTRRISSWQWQAFHSDPWPVGHVESQTSIAEDDAATTASSSESQTDNEDFIASLDALALSEDEREVLGRMQLVVESARVARERRQGWSYGDEVGIGSGVDPTLRLRGGASSSPSDDLLPFRTPRRRTTLPVEDPVFPKANSDRPPRALWWLAGGGKGKVPTVGELRVRKEVERANRRVVGFWGTVLGVRRVGRVGVLEEGGDGGDGDGDGDAGGSDGGGMEDVEAGSSHGSRSLGSIAGGSGAGGGSSLASSRREREIEVDQPVETKADSAMSVADADHDPGHENEDMMDEPTEDHESKKSGSGKDTGAKEPKARSESTKGVADDHASAKSGETKDAGGDEPKPRPESAKSVAEDHKFTEDGGETDAGVEEPKSGSESAKSVAEDAARAEVESVRSKEVVAETEDKNIGEKEPKSATNDG